MLKEPNIFEKPEENISTNKNRPLGRFVLSETFRQKTPHTHSVFRKQQNDGKNDHHQNEQGKKQNILQPAESVLVHIPLRF